MKEGLVEGTQASVKWTLGGARVGMVVVGALGVFLFGWTGLLIGAVAGALIGGLASLLFSLQI